MQYIHTLSPALLRQPEQIYHMHAVVMGYALIGVGPPHIYACSSIILICIYLYIFNTLPYNELRSYAAVLRRRGLSTREPPHHARYVTVHLMFGLLSAA